MLLCAVLLASTFVSCKKADESSSTSISEIVSTVAEKAPTLDELLSLGEKYLLELNYEQALVQFLKVIEIEPMNPRAIAGAVGSYVGRGTAVVLGGENEENLAKALADFEAALELDDKDEGAWLALIDVYIRRGDYEKALELAKEACEKNNSEALQAKLAELESGNVNDLQGQTRRISTYGGDGSLQYYWDYSYAANRQSSVTSYDSNNAKTGYVEYQYDNDGNQTVGSYYNTETGEMCKVEDMYNQSGQNISSIWYENDGTINTSVSLFYDDEGNQAERQWYDAAGKLTQRNTYDFDDEGREIRENCYDKDGKLTSYYASEYDGKGYLSRYSEYDGDGELQSYDIYTYDDNGKRTGREIYNADGTLHGSVVFE